MPSIIFCGTPDFAVPSLQALINDPSFTVTHVITQQDRPVGRTQDMQAPPVKQLAQRHGLPVWQPQSLNKEWATYINHLQKPDFLVVVAYGQIISQDVLDYPMIAPVNVHGSLLPRWRGASPVEHAILQGDTLTGITIQIMVRELDAGPILATQSLPITQGMTALALRNQLSTMAAPLLVDTLKKPLHPVPQPMEGMTICRKLSREDGLVDPMVMTAMEIERRIRAFAPWPGVTCTHLEREIKIIDATLKPTKYSVPLACADSTILHLMTVQEAGKKAMAAAEWLRGVR